MDLSKYASFVNTLSNSWSDIVCTFWMKYPNQFSKHVLSEDVLDRRVTKDGKLYTRRLLSKTNNLPSWGHFVFKSQKQLVHIVEESLVDPATGFMKVYTWNVSYKYMMDVQESMTITRSSEAHGETTIVRHGWVDSSMTGFRRLLRQFGIARWKSNAKKAQLGFLSVLNGTESAGSLHNMKEHTLESMKEASDKARRQARNLASLASNIQTKSERQCS